MRQLQKAGNRRIRIVLLAAFCAVFFAALKPTSAKAATIAEIQKQIEETQAKISGINGKIENLEEQQELLEEQKEDLNAEIINTMAEIGIKEEDIATMEEEIFAKEAEIGLTQKQYEEAKAKEEYRYKCMVIRAQRMYEKGGVENYVDEILAQSGLGDMLNRMDYIERVYEYDRRKMKELTAIRQEVKALWEQLELEKAELQSKKEALEAEKAFLEEQKKELDIAFEELKKQSASFESELKRWQQEASIAKRLLKQEQSELKKLQDEEKKKNAANMSVAATNYDAIIDGANGSDLGKKIAKYGCQYIGNPYVAGGTSLTNGADCSGFTWRIYKDFGYDIPRTSATQRNCGTGVTYEEAQPGDLICYSGHVALYIGGGKIVHASSAKTGIKVSNASYRAMLAVRRVI